MQSGKWMDTPYYKYIIAFHVHGIINTLLQTAQTGSVWIYI